MVTSFNSKLVRLKEFQSNGSIIRFQFQTGAIRSVRRMLLLRHRSRFNSKLVRLEVAFFGSSTTTHTRFNSKLVRLESGKIEAYEEHNGKFQFQTGSIKRHGDNRNAGICWVESFNSKLVRLEA